mgnify:CR=1 FL=1
MISETDLKDWKETFSDLTPDLEVKELYNVPRNSVISLVTNPKQLIQFFHVDGMYSFCKLFGTNDIVHLKAWTPVYVWNKIPEKV